MLQVLLLDQAAVVAAGLALGVLQGLARVWVGLGSGWRGSAGAGVQLRRLLLHQGARQ